MFLEVEARAPPRICAASARESTGFGCAVALETLTELMPIKSCSAAVEFSSVTLFVTLDMLSGVLVVFETFPEKMKSASDGVEVALEKFANGWADVMF